MKIYGYVILSIVILILIILAIYLITKRKKEKGARDEAKETSKGLKELNKNPKTKQTITKQQAAAIANTLETAMSGYGTDTLAIYKNLMLLRNEADYLAVSDAFGIREISSGRGNPTPNFKGTLSAALTDELGTTDVTNTTKINTMLKQRGISLTI